MTEQRQAHTHVRSIRRARPVVLPFTHEDRMKDQHARSKTNLTAFGMTERGGERERESQRPTAGLGQLDARHKSRQIAAANVAETSFCGQFNGQF